MVVGRLLMVGDRPQRRKKERKEKKKEEKKEKYNKNIKKLKETTKLYNSTKCISFSRIEILCSYQAYFYIQILFPGKKIIFDKKIFSGTKSLPNAS